MNLSHNVKHVKAKAILQLQKVLAEFHQFSFCTESFPLIGWNNLKAIFLWNANNSAKTNTITRELSYWIFLKMFHIHLNIQRLNIGGFRGDEMDLPDNLDSFHPLKVWIWSIKMTSENKANYYEIVMKFQNRSTSYVERIWQNLLSSVNRVVSRCQGSNSPEWLYPICLKLESFQFHLINVNKVTENLLSERNFPIFLIFYYLLYRRSSKEVFLGVDNNFLLNL